MFKRRILILACLILVTLVILLFTSMHQTKNIHRDLKTLMNKYYRLKHTHPQAAQHALDIVLAQNSNYIPALQELSQWYLQHKNFKKALPILERLHRLKPKAFNYTYQLAYLYYDNTEWLKAEALFSQLVNQGNPVLKIKAKQALLAMNSSIASYRNFSTMDAMVRQESLGCVNNSSSESRRPATCSRHPEISSKTSTHDIKWDPHGSREQVAGCRNINCRQTLYSLKEKGYLSLQKHQILQALQYFKRAYALNSSSNLAMQLGYLYDQIGDKPTAYQYFRLATQSANKKRALCAENAMTNLSGMQTKGLPPPYFSEIFFNPFSQTRFGLTVRPLIVRAGVEEGNILQTKQYVFLRRVDDNQSQNLGQISQIYEDNVQVTGIGGQITPIVGVPIVGFLEAGTAYDLIYRDRDRWRGDLRGGFMYYNEFGARPAYFDCLTWSTKYFSDVYADITYFSRYNNNVISGMKTHQGIRLLQYHSSMLNLYLTGRMITDTNRYFYNNYAEGGPGISFIPSNRFYNVQIRFEHVNGVYIPAGAVPNPYRKHYSNSLVQLNYYVKF